MTPDRPRRNRPPWTTPARGRPHATLLLSTCVTLALLTGIVLDQTWTQLTPTPVTSAPHDEATLAAARQFYAALNDAVRTGTTDAITALLAPDFIDHGEDASTHRSDEDLVHAIHAIAASQPGFRVVPTELIASADRVLVHAQIEGVEQPDILGMLLDDPPTLSTHEVLSVDNGRIVERWGPPFGATQVVPMVDVPVDAHTLGQRRVALHRLTLTAAASFDIPAANLSAAVNETGMLSVSVPVDAPGPAVIWHKGRLSATDSRDMVRPNERALLEPGDVAVATDNVTITVTNAGRSAVRLLLFTVIDEPVGSPSTEIKVLAPRGETVQILAGGAEIEMPFGPARLKIARVTLPPGTTLAPHPASHAEMVAVDAGRLRVISGDATMIVTQDRELHDPTDLAVLTEGAGAVIPHGAVVAMRADGTEPTVAVIVRLVSDDAHRTRAGSD